MKNLDLKQEKVLKLSIHLFFILGLMETRSNNNNLIENKVDTILEYLFFSDKIQNGISNTELRLVCHKAFLILTRYIILGKKLQLDSNELNYLENEEISLINDNSDYNIDHNVFVEGINIFY
jgi:hypothetical protein